MKDFRSAAVPALASDLKALTDASKNLNRSTDELTQQIEQIESTINALNLGLRASVIAEADDDESPLWTHYTRLLYDKNDGAWGLVIDEFYESVSDEHTKHDYKGWRFSDAPRASRLKVIDKIPELLKVLVRESEAMAERVGEKLNDAKAIASSLFAPAPDGPVRK
jgi:hypothetical protein